MTSIRFTAIVLIVDLAGRPTVVYAEKLHRAFHGKRDFVFRVGYAESIFVDDRESEMCDIVTVGNKLGGVGLQLHLLWRARRVQRESTKFSLAVAADGLQRAGLEIQLRSPPALSLVL